MPESMRWPERGRLLAILPCLLKPRMHVWNFMLQACIEAALWPAHIQARCSSFCDRSAQLREWMGRLARGMMAGARCSL